MLKIRSYLLVAVVVYLITLLSALPASLIVDRLDKQLGDDFYVSQTSGTVWKGRVQGLIKGQNFNLAWDLHLLDLLLLRLAADVHFKADLFEVKSELSFAYKTISINALTGLVKAALINNLSNAEDFPIQIESDIYLKQINLKRSHAEFAEASGQIDWEGGLVKAKDLPEGEINLPPSQANISLSESGVSLNIGIKEKNTAGLVDIDLSHDGKAHLKLKERVADYVDVPQQLKTGNPDGIMFEIKRQIFETQGKF